MVAAAAKKSGRAREPLLAPKLKTLLEPYFDAAYYRRHRPDVTGTDEELLVHYLNHGWSEGANPSRSFSTRFYLRMNPDVAAAQINPLLHYVHNGQQEGRNPTPLRMVTPEWEKAAARFDAQFYRDRNPDVIGDDDELFTHYMTQGWKDGRNPAPWFATTFYRDHAGLKGKNPFVHFILTGEAEGRHPNPEAERDAKMAADIAAVSDDFDAEYYRANNPDVFGSDEDLLRQFMTKGWTEGRDPSAEFSTTFYLERYPDIGKAKLHPFVHYIIAGRSEGRLGKMPHNGIIPRKVSASDLASAAEHFDPEFYRAAHPEVEGTDAELLDYFMSIGWQEGHDPRRDFSTRYYLDTYPDIAGSGTNPFLHYVVFGRHEGRRCTTEGPLRLLRDPAKTAVPEHLRAALFRPADAPQAKPPVSVNRDSMTIHWIVPDFARGGGGHMTIFRMVRLMEIFGHRNKIWIERPVAHATADAAYQDIVKYFQCVSAEVDFVENGLMQASGDVLVATGWSTAYIANAASGFAGKFYLVQDHEIEFYATGADSILARATYDLDLACICASTWLKQMMETRYGRWARHFELAYDPAVYHPPKPDLRVGRPVASKSNPVRIAVYSRDTTARRCVALALMALDILGKRRDDFEVHFFGQSNLPFSSVGYAAYNHGVLDAEKLAELYGRCDLGVCFSGTNYSLVPQEMMATGLPIVELDGESTRAIFPEGTLTFAGPDPFDIAQKISSLMDDADLRTQQAARGIDWVETFSWELSARKVEAAFRELLDSRAVPKAPSIARPRSTRLDVVIPTYNGLGEVKPVIEALRRQRGKDDVQIYCIDSSSTDGTTEWLRKQADISLTVIPSSQFQHGRTRNDGAALGRSPLIAMLTQDAIPAGNYWAHDIIAMMDHYPGAAGLFGRHIPYPDHPEYVRQEIRGHFEHMLKHPIALSKHTDPERWESGDRGWRQLLHFYSDNNSAMRRVTWEDIPYPEVDYGEDQVWADRIIEAGYTKLYAPTAAVYHSHDYNPEQTYKRSRTEGEFFARYFGYRLASDDAATLAANVDSEQRDFMRWALIRKISAEETEMRRANIAEKHRGWRDGQNSVSG